MNQTASAETYYHLVHHLVRNEASRVQLQILDETFPLPPWYLQDSSKYPRHLFIFLIRSTRLIPIKVSSASMESDCLSPSCCRSRQTIIIAGRNEELGTGARTIGSKWWPGLKKFLFVRNIDELRKKSMKFHA